MKPKNLFLVALIGLIFSCTNESTNQQEILSENEMAHLLIDIHLLEVKLSKLKVNKDSMRKIYNRFERGILEENGLTKENYERSFEYYMSKPDQMEYIYTMVVDSLNLREQKAMLEVKNAEEEKRKKKHSPKLPRSRAKSDSMEMDSVRVPIAKPSGN